MSLQRFAEFLHERIGPIEAESNKRHAAEKSDKHAGPDPKVQRELKNAGILYRVAVAYARKKK